MCVIQPAIELAGLLSARKRGGNEVNQFGAKLEEKAGDRNGK